MPAAKIWRVSVTIVALIAIEAAVCGLAATPVAALWWWAATWTAMSGISRVVLISVAVVPSYVLFAFGVMGWSALATRVTGARTPLNAQLSMADLEWPVLRWARYVVSIHVVRVLAGTLFRGSPIWTAYLRLNGARIGSRVYVNTTSISDHNLLDFGDDVVIGDGVHLSGHTVEAGFVKTGRVRLGDRVTIGLNSVIDIGVEVGDDCQVGALTFVPKHSVLESGAIYGGIPARRIR